MSKVDLDDPFRGIVECAVHTTGMDADCEHCDSEFKAKSLVNDAIRMMVEKNAKDLARDGFQLHPVEMIAARLELLIESVFRDRNRIHFEVECARRIAQGQEHAKTQVTRQKLLGNGRPMPNVPDLDLKRRR